MFSTAQSYEYWLYVPHLRYVFYVFGSLGILWFFAWSVLVYDGPDVHPRISQEEREYLEVGYRKYLFAFNNKNILSVLPV